jgi:hypothetical protein
VRLAKFSGFNICVATPCLSEQIAPYVSGALFATVTLALTIVCYFAGFYRTSVGVAAASVIALFIYKVAVVGCC